MNSALKERAISLRKKGLKYNEISNDLGCKIPKGTMSYWCGGVKQSTRVLERRRKENLRHLARARVKALEVNRLKQEMLRSNIRAKNQHLSLSSDRGTQKIALAMLYLGEGTKWESHRGLALGNSSPLVINLYLNLLKLCYDITSDTLTCRVQCRADQNIRKLERYWSMQTGIPFERFRKAWIDPRTVGKKTKKKDYMGVLVITGGSTEYQQELHIISEILLQNIMGR